MKLLFFTFQIYSFFVLKLLFFYFYGNVPRICANSNYSFFTCKLLFFTFKLLFCYLKLPSFCFEITLFLIHILRSRYFQNYFPYPQNYMTYPDVEQNSVKSKYRPTIMAHCLYGSLQLGPLALMAPCPYGPGSVRSSFVTVIVRSGHRSGRSSLGKVIDRGGQRSERSSIR